MAFRDRTWMKVFVAFLYLADLMHSIFMVTYMYNDLITHFGDVLHLLTSNWVFATDPALTGIIGGSVQLFFAWRVKVLTGNIWLVSVIAACAIGNCLCAIGASIAGSIITNFLEFQKFKAVVTTWLVCAAVADVIITFSLVWHLRKHKRGFAATDDVIDRIIRLTVQTGMITAIWAVVNLIIYLIDTTALHLLFNITLSKLYTNSLMSSLNSRGGWQFSGSSQTGSKAPQHDMRRTDVVQLQSRPEVFVHVESHEMADPVLKSDGNVFNGSKDSW
jgi:hypothetical protein